MFTAKIWCHLHRHFFDFHTPSDIGTVEYTLDDLLVE
jgi:hypothetical protein